MLPAATESPEEKLKRLLVGEELDLLSRLEERCNALEERVGDDAAVIDTTKRVIADVLQEAGVADHQRLANAIVPFVVGSIKTEIRNSTDDMVDALYPITGRLVGAYVASAIAELTEKINSQLQERMPFADAKRKLQSTLSGRSEADILLAETTGFSVRAMYLIHRSTGLLIKQIGVEETEAMDADILAGMLTAVMTFVQSAFAGDREEPLRSFAFGEAKVFLRASPSLILAVRTEGTATNTFEGRMERLFNAFLESWGDELRDYDGMMEPETEEAIEIDLRNQANNFPAAIAGDGNDVAVIPEALTKRSMRPVLYTIGGLVGFAMVIWLVDAYYESATIGNLEQIVADQPAMIGYPLKIERTGMFKYEFTGLVPDQHTLAALEKAVDKSGVTNDVVYTVSVVRLNEGQKQ